MVTLRAQSGYNGNGLNLEWETRNHVSFSLGLGLIRRWWLLSGNIIPGLVELMDNLHLKVMIYSIQTIVVKKFWASFFAGWHTLGTVFTFLTQTLSMGCIHEQLVCIGGVVLLQPTNNIYSTTPEPLGKMNSSDLVTNYKWNWTVRILHYSESQLLFYKQSVCPVSMGAFRHLFLHIHTPNNTLTHLIATVIAWYYGRKHSWDNRLKTVGVSG